MGRFTKLLGFLGLAVLSAPGYADLDCDKFGNLFLPETTIPAVATQGNTAADFVPAQWRLVDKVEDDFNGDKLADLAVVIVATDPSNVLKEECDGSPANAYDTNPYCLIVALQQHGGGYLLAGQDFGLIPPVDSSVSKRPYDTLSAKKGVLHLNYSTSYSTVPGNRDTYSYLFRFEKSCMRLIGYEHQSVENGHKEIKSINFLTGKSITSQGKGKALSERTEKLEDNPLHCLSPEMQPVF